MVKADNVCVVGKKIDHKASCGFPNNYSDWTLWLFLKNSWKMNGIEFSVFVMYLFFTMFPPEKDRLSIKLCYSYLHTLCFSLYAISAEESNAILRPAEWNVCHSTLLWVNICSILLFSFVVYIVSCIGGSKAQ